MSDLVVIVPSRGRPHTFAELAQAFKATCRADTELVFAVDDDDPARDHYSAAARTAPYRRSYVGVAESSGMVRALNQAALYYAGTIPQPPLAIGFLGDDHRPLTVGWDTRYLDALRELGTGIAYGNDLLQGERLPTQCAMTADIVAALGYMAPPGLTHLAVDDAWLTLGRAADCIRYLPDVIVEHQHPVAGKADWDAGYARVNSRAMYQRDLTEFERWVREDLLAAAARVRALRQVPA